MKTLKDSKPIRFLRDLPGAFSVYSFYGRTSARGGIAIQAKRFSVIGVTGTKGKTTRRELLNAILEAEGKRTALLPRIA